MQLNTAVSAMMELVNELYAFTDKIGADQAGARRRAREVGAGDARGAREAVEALVLMLSPFAPHMAEELWERSATPTAWSRPAGRRSTPRSPAEEAIVVPVQVNGKVRGRVSVPAGIDEAALEAAALADPHVQAAHRRQDHRRRSSSPKAVS